MWLRKVDLNYGFREEEILDEVEIDGMLWVEIEDEKGDEDVQSSFKRTLGQDALQVKMPLPNAND